MIPIRWRLAPVPMIAPNQAEGAPGPSHLGTGDGGCAFPSRWPLINTGQAGRSHRPAPNPGMRPAIHIKCITINRLRSKLTTLTIFCHFCTILGAIRCLHRLRQRRKYGEFSHYPPPVNPGGYQSCANIPLDKLQLYDNNQLISLKRPGTTSRSGQKTKDRSATQCSSTNAAPGWASTTPKNPTSPSARFPANIRRTQRLQFLPAFP